MKSSVRRVITIKCDTVDEAKAFTEVARMAHVRAPFTDGQVDLEEEWATMILNAAKELSRIIEKNAVEQNPHLASIITCLTMEG